MPLNRKFKLNSGYEMPAVGLGTWVRVFSLPSRFHKSNEAYIARNRD
jgi:hypothetical protein